MTKAITIPDQSRYGLLLSLVLLAIVHVQGLPWWVLACSGFVFVWFLGQTRWRFVEVPTWIRSVVAVSSLVGIAVHFRSLQSLDAYVSLLLMMQAQKLLELHSARDLFFAVFIGMFAAVTRLLYAQQFSDILMAFITIALLFFVLYARYSTVSVTLGQALRNVSLLLLKASPLAAVLFFLFPRIPPMITLPELGTSGTSGVSNRVEPGSISRLARSSEPAFRASFEGPVPEVDKLYWRGVVLSKYDGRAWSMGRVFPIARDWLQEYKTESNSLTYSVRMEPSNQHWLFTLAISRNLDKFSAPINGFAVGTPNPIVTARTFTFEQVDTPLREGLSSADIRQLTYIPEGSNPRTVALGQKLAQQYDSAAEIVDAISGMISASYSYSLNSPLLGQHNADEFFFDTQIGYCEHYANAAGVLLRAAGIPTRLIGGYLGGEQNPYEDFVLVRQLDAHAWLEYWQADQGWVRYDPTASVAPERIRQGSEASLRQRDEYSTTAWRSMQNLAVLRSFLQWADAKNYAFGRWLEDYDRGQQYAFIERMTGIKGTATLLTQVFVIAAIAVTLPFSVIALMGLFSQRAPFGLSLKIADRALRIAGFTRKEHQSPQQLITTHPQLPKDYHRLVSQWYETWYLGQPTSFWKSFTLVFLSLRLWAWSLVSRTFDGSFRKPKEVSS